MYDFVCSKNTVTEGDLVAFSHMKHKNKSVCL